MQIAGKVVCKDDDLGGQVDKRQAEIEERIFDPFKARLIKTQPPFGIQLRHFPRGDNRNGQGFGTHPESQGLRDQARIVDMPDPDVSIQENQEAFSRFGFSTESGSEIASQSSGSVAGARGSSKFKTEPRIDSAVRVAVL